MRVMLSTVMVYTFYCYWSESTASLVYRDKIADQDRKIAAYRLSRDDELKNAVVLETRLTSCTEQRTDLREQVNSLEVAANNNQRMTREIKSLKEIIQTHEADLEECKVSKILFYIDKLVSLSSIRSRSLLKNLNICIVSLEKSC